MSDLRLIDRRPTQRPHIQSPAELQAYVKGRLDARARYNENETVRRAAEQAAWRKAQATRRRFLFWVVVVSALLTAAGNVYLMETAGKAGVGLVLSLALMGVATYLSFREER